MIFNPLLISLLYIASIILFYIFSLQILKQNNPHLRTLISAVILFFLGSGPVKGFATVLFWGILISMVTAIFVTRTIFNSITKGKQLKTLSI